MHKHIGYLKGAMAMADTWVTDISHFLDEEGKIISKPIKARNRAEYLTTLIVMTTFSDPEYAPEYRVNCRRRPNRKPCLEAIVGFVDPETDDIVWMCPKCEDRGVISNWQGTIWDMSNAGGFPLKSKAFEPCFYTS
jgi:hypothetical protein